MLQIVESSARAPRKRPNFKPACIRNSAMHQPLLFFSQSPRSGGVALATSPHCAMRVAPASVEPTSLAPPDSMLGTASAAAARCVPVCRRQPLPIPVHARTLLPLLQQPGNWRRLHMMLHRRKRRSFPQSAFQNAAATLLRIPRPTLSRRNVPSARESPPVTSEVQGRSPVIHPFERASCVFISHVHGDLILTGWQPTRAAEASD